MPGQLNSSEGSNEQTVYTETATTRVPADDAATNEAGVEVNEVQVLQDMNVDEEDEDEEVFYVWKTKKKIFRKLVQDTFVEFIQLSNLDSDKPQRIVIQGTFQSFSMREAVIMYQPKWQHLKECQMTMNFTESGKIVFVNKKPRKEE